MSIQDKIMQDADKLIIKYANGLPITESQRQKIRIEFLKGFEKALELCADLRLSRVIECEYLLDFPHLGRNRQNMKDAIARYSRDWGEFIGTLVGLFELRPDDVLTFRNEIAKDLYFLKDAPYFYKYIISIFNIWEKKIKKKFVSMPAWEGLYIDFLRAIKSWR